MQLGMSGEIDGTRPADKMGEKFINALEGVSEKLSSFLSKKSYGSEVEELNVIPIIMKLPEKMEKAGWHKERKLFKRKSKSTDFRLRIDYDEFLQADDEKREKLIIRNIIDSVRILNSRTTKNFNGELLEADILGLFNFEYIEL